MRDDDRLRTLLGAAALAAIVFACYAPSLGGGFLWDDDANVSENPTIRTLRGLRYIWTEPHANQQFYPLTHTSFWLEHRAWGLWPTGFRITNLVLHVLAAVLLWRALRVLAVPGAWVAAAIFAIHPVHVESVAWITERKNVLSAVFTFGALLAYLRFAGIGEDEGQSTRRGRVYGLSLLLFGCALLSKTAVLTLPAAILVLIWWKKGRVGRADVVATLPLFGLGAAFGVVTAWLERQHVGAAGPEWDLGLVERILVGGRALWFYATQLVFPFRLNFIYPRWSVDATALWQYAFPVGVVVVLVALWLARSRVGRGPLAGVAIFGLTLAPALGFLDFYFQLYSFVQDHFQYLASAGLIATLTACAAIGLGRVHASAAVSAATVVLLVLGGLTWQRSRTFTSEEALWTSVLERNPRAWMADINLGLAYEREGRLDAAEERLRHALGTEHPEHDKARYNLGRILEQRGDFRGAEQQYEQALAVNPRNADAHNNLGTLLAGDGRVDEAIEQFRAAVDADPMHIVARYNLGLRLADRGQDFEAERHLREAIRINPGYAAALDVLGRIVGRQGRNDEAAQLYRRALAIDPDRYDVHYNLALTLEQLGDLDGAERHYRAAIRLEPGFADSHNNLAIVLYHEHRYDEAWEQVRLYQSKGGTPHPDFLSTLSRSSPPP